MPENNKPLAIISGGTGYLGSATALLLEKKGWTVATIGRNTKEDAPMHFTCDITNEEEVKKAVETITHAHGPIHACIHAASGAVDGKAPLLSLTAELFDSQIIIAARGAFLLAKVAQPYMVKDAAFIGITSALIEPGTSLQPMGSYIAAKYAMRGFLRSLKGEVMAQGIRVYAIAPGYMPGGLNRGIPEAVLKFLGKKSGAGDSDAQAVGEIIVKICTEPSSYPSGSSIVIPGEVHPL